MKYRGRRAEALPSSMQPRACALNGGDHRQLRCHYYGRCLQVAVEGDWPGFDCLSCNGYLPLSPSELQRDLPGLARILAEICRRTDR